MIVPLYAGLPRARLTAFSIFTPVLCDTPTALFMMEWPHNIEPEDRTSFMPRDVSLELFLYFPMSYVLPVHGEKCPTI